MFGTIKAFAGGVLEVGKHFEEWMERELDEGADEGLSELEEGARACSLFQTDQVLQFIESDEYELLGADEREIIEPPCDQYLSICFKLDSQNEQLEVLALELGAALSTLRTWTKEKPQYDPDGLKELRVRIANLRLDVSECRERRRRSEKQQRDQSEKLVSKITEVRLSRYLKRVDAQQVEFPGSAPRGKPPSTEVVYGQSTSCRAKQLRRRGQRQQIVSDEELAALLSEC